MTRDVGAKTDVTLTDEDTDSITTNEVSYHGT